MPAQDESYHSSAKTIDVPSRQSHSVEKVIEADFWSCFQPGSVRMSHQENILAKPLITPTSGQARQRPSTVNASNQSYRTQLSSSPTKIDFVIIFKCAENIDEAAKGLQYLLQKIAARGLQLQVRAGNEPSEILIFVKCSEEMLQREVHAARSRDWISGIRVAVPGMDVAKQEEKITDSERLRLVFLILTAPEDEQGVGITPKLGAWKCVECIFPLHNPQFDQAWLKRWATKWTIDDVELDHLREHFGTKIAMYFAFLQFYFLSLAVPALLGLLAFFFLPEYSALYSIGISLWANVFHGLWKRRQAQLAIHWDVRNCSQMEHRRAAFVQSAASKEIDSPDGLKLGSFSPLTRLLREAWTIPFGFVAGSFLAAVLTTIFAVEVFMGEVYDGPLKSVLTFTPTILFSVLVGPFSSFYMKTANKLTLYENHETDAKFNAAITRKSFLLNFMTSYTALFLTLYVYLPFGHIVVPKLDVFGITSAYASYGVKAKPFVLDNTRIRNQLFYFAVTAQIVNLFMEFVLPIILRVIKGEAQELQAKFTGHNAYHPVDIPEEAAFLKQVRYEATLPEYDTYGDFAEMVVQFGYTVMFSPIWPLTPVCAFLNNIVELRADAAKLCKNMKRPVPMRADSIGPWADNLVLLTWLGSLTTSSIVYLLSGHATSSKSFFHLLGVLFFSEHAYLLLRTAVDTILGRLPDSTELSVKLEESAIRQDYLTKLTSNSTADVKIATTIDPFFERDFSALSNRAYELVKNSKSLSSKKKEL